jgi:hypothetical protein
MKRIAQFLMVALILSFVASVGWSGTSSIRNDVVLLNGVTFRDATTPDTVKKDVGGQFITTQYPYGASKSNLYYMRADSLYHQWTVTDSTHLEISMGVKTAYAAAPASFTPIDTINQIVAAQGVNAKVSLVDVTGYDQIWFIYKPLTGNKKAVATGNKVYDVLQLYYTPVTR